MSGRITPSLRLSSTTYPGQPPSARNASSCSRAQTSWLVFHTTLRKLLPEYFSVITNRYGRRYLPRRTSVERALPVVDLRLLAGQELQHVEALGRARLQRRHEALHRVVRVLEAVRLDQVLVDAHRVAAELAPAPRSRCGGARTPTQPPRLSRARMPRSKPVAGVGEFARPGRPSRWPPRGSLTAVGSGGSSCDPPPSCARSRAAWRPARAASGWSRLNVASRRSILSPLVCEGARLTSRRRPAADQPRLCTIRWGNLGWPQVGEFGWPPGVRPNPLTQ